MRRGRTRGESCAGRSLGGGSLSVRSAVALDVLSTCNTDASVPSLAAADLTSYASPADVGGATACACSVPLYNLLSACSYCQRIVRP
jgi:hypothetical protein